MNKMEKDTIITLEDNEIYALLDETMLENKKYFFAVRLDDKNNPTSNYEIFEQDETDDGIYMNAVDDEVLKETVMLEFSNNYIQNIKESD